MGAVGAPGRASGWPTARPLRSHRFSLDTGMWPVSNACSGDPGEVADGDGDAHPGNPGCRGLALPEVSEVAERRQRRISWPVLRLLAPWAPLGHGRAPSSGADRIQTWRFPMTFYGTAPNIQDVTAKTNTHLRHGTRVPTMIDAAVLHQTAFTRGNIPELYL